MMFLKILIWCPTLFSLFLPLVSDPKLAPLPKLLRAHVQEPSCTAQQFTEEIGREDKPQGFCQWAEGWPASSCCVKDYKLVVMDQRYGRVGKVNAKKADVKIEIPPFLGIEGMSRRHPLCRNRQPWIYPLVCAWDWYWVPRALW
uniref:Thyroglobulin type-1 domain-containing protein n=1 Tax=Globodera pallida TaxID=36090 RepID=A0A183CBK6_GLOPA